MLELLFLYLVGFIVGLMLGIFSPILVPAWMIVLFGGLGIVIVSEAVGHWGFGHRWHDHRLGWYILWPAVAVCTLLGFLFGTGAVGRFLVAVGTFLS